MPTSFTNLRAAGTLAVVGAATFAGGVAFSSAVTSTSTATYTIVYATGGLLPITEDLTSADYEGDGTASGFSIQNPYSEAVLCDRVSIRTATAPTHGATTVDIDVGTGTFLSGAASGKTLTDSYTFAAGVHTASGTRVADSNGYSGGFVLDAAGGTTDYFLLGGETGTGGGLVADFHARCYSLD